MRTLRFDSRGASAHARERAGDGVAERPLEGEPRRVIAAWRVIPPSPPTESNRSAVSILRDQPGREIPDDAV